ncbi:hypothetical protein IMSAGC013_00381 [Lachnospiraceae bacterium]|nr:hypothetical protein IMSAGC013_00381 [Lachnospiraceae bacterium]
MSNIVIVINREFISKNNTYAGRNVPVYICVHETDNKSKGAGARRHAEAQFLGHLGTSVQYYAGSDGIYQAAEPQTAHIPLEQSMAETMQFMTQTTGILSILKSA